MPDRDDEVIDGPGPLFMRHPETGGVAQTTQEAYDALWKEKGWELDLTTDAATVAHEQRLRQVSSTLGIEDLRKETKEVLAEVAGQLGRSVPKGAKKDEIVALIESPESPEDGTTNAGQP